MIRDDRVQLNERFRKVFALLEERGEIVKNDRGGRGLGDFAHKLLGNRAYGHIIRAFLNEDDKRCIDYRHARILCREYGVNESYMIDGTGTPFGFDLPKERREAIEDGVGGNILFTTTQAFAGSTVGADSFIREENDFFRIPGLIGNGFVAFPINGNSMTPVINDGDVVICREVESVASIRDNKIYAIKNNGQMWVKYVQKIPNSKGRIAQLKLVSANHLEHDPFVEEVGEYTRIYEVVRRLSTL